MSISSVSQPGYMKTTEIHKCALLEKSKLRNGKQQNWMILYAEDRTCLKKTKSSPVMRPKINFKIIRKKIIKIIKKHNAFSMQHIEIQNKQIINQVVENAQLTNVCSNNFFFKVQVNTRHPLLLKLFAYSVWDRPFVPHFPSYLGLTTVVTALL